ncbi:MAG: methionyl-tRNA formyltransferase [Clostridia bacterium]|nr:methionyl-tRNA formyltransferase [Clostridia bacterium]
MMKVAFLGSSNFSLVVLKKLLESKHKVVCVCTNLDKECGRGQKINCCPVKFFAEKNNIPVLQFKSISKEGFDAVKSFSPDVLVTASFGQILRQNILELAPYGVINVHASLLPKYRGSCPINWAIINVEKTTGVTIMKTALGLDTGDMISKEETTILKDENVEELSARLAELGGELLVETLFKLEKNEVTFTPQNEEESSYFPMLSKEMAKIDFTKSVFQIENFVRGLNPWPVAWVQVDDEKLKVFKVTKAENIWGLDLSKFKNGQVVKSSGKTGLVVKCEDGLILLDVIQPQNGKQMKSTAFLNGKKIDEKTQL